MRIIKMSNLPLFQTIKPLFKIKIDKLCLKGIQPVMKNKSIKRLIHFIFKKLSISFIFKTWKTLTLAIALSYQTEKSNTSIKRQSIANFQTLIQESICQKDRTWLPIKTNTINIRLKKLLKAKFLRLLLNQTSTLNSKKTFRVSKVPSNKVRLVILNLIKAW